MITDLGILEPHPESRELVLTRIHPGVTVEEVRAATGWPLKVSDELQQTEPPSRHYLDVMRDLQERTAPAHAGNA